MAEFWYIHWHHENYKKYGINYPNENGSGGAKSNASLASYFQSARSELLSKEANKIPKPNLGHINALENLYSYLIFGPDVNHDYTAQFKKELNIDIDDLFKEIQNKILPTILNNSGMIYDRGNIGLNSKTGMYAQTEFGGKTKINAKDVEKVRQRLCASIRELETNIVNPKKLAKDRALLKELEKITGSISLNENQPLFLRIKDRMRADYRQVYGYGLEAILSSVSIALSNELHKSKKEIIEMLKKISTGRSTSGMSINIEDWKLSQEEAEQIFNKQVNKDGVTITTSARSNKTDVIFSFEDVDLNISAKYSGKKSKQINVLSGTSLVPYISDGTIDKEWFTHYLNIITSPADKIYEDYSSARKQAIDTFKVLMAAKALTGHVGGKAGVADTMIVADGASRRVKIIFLQDVIKRLESFVETETGIRVTDQKGGKDLGILSLMPVTGSGVPNKQSANARVASIVAQLHAQKFKVTIDKDKLLNG